MKGLVNKIIELKGKEDLRKKVDMRLQEFKETGKKGAGELFKELCFCILTANFNAKRAIEMQERLGDAFLNASVDILEARLREMGHRYPKARARYIIEARRHKDSLKRIISSFRDKEKLRDWIVKNIKGMGYKEASHFLRNIGIFDFAIIDFHIIELLKKEGIIEEETKSMSRKRYLKIESILKGLAKLASMSLGELDLYLWYMETGKVLK